MAARSVDLDVRGLRHVLGNLRQFPKDASAELRQEARKIAEERRLPAWKDAALNYGGPWGSRIADDITVRSDRVPSLRVGKQRKKFSGGASTNMVRYLSDAGNQGIAGDNTPPAFGEGLHWIRRRADYRREAMKDYEEALRRVIRKWEAEP
mgnify:CR=1 FL=1